MDNFRFRFEDLDKLILAHDPKIVQQAHKSTILKTTRKLKTFVKDAVRERYTVKTGAIVESLKFRKFFQDKSQPFAILEYSGKKIGLQNFSTGGRFIRTSGPKLKNVKRRFVTVKALKAEKRKVVRNKKAFKVISNKGVTHILFRRGESRDRLISLKGPSVAHMVRNETTIKRVETFLTFELPAQFDHELEFFLLKKIGLR